MGGEKGKKSINCSVIGVLFIAATDFIIRIFTLTLSNQIDEALHIQTGHFSPPSYITHMSFPPFSVNYTSQLNFYKG